MFKYFKPALIALGVSFLPQKAAAYDIDCKIILCLPAGFPSGCGDAYRTFIARITARPPKPPIGHCPMGSASGIELPEGRPTPEQIAASIRGDDDEERVKLPGGRPAIDDMKQAFIDTAIATQEIMDRTIARMVERGADESLLNQLRDQRDEAMPRAHQMGRVLESVRCTVYYRPSTYRYGGGEDAREVPGTFIYAIDGDGGNFTATTIPGRYRGNKCDFEDVDGNVLAVGTAERYHAEAYNCHRWGRDDEERCSYRYYWVKIARLVDLYDDGG